MAQKKSALGRGLGALIPDIDVTSESDGVVKIDINQIEPNEEQPRKKFDEEKLQELSDSIKEHGIVQPVILKKEGRNYKLIAGERRWRAARMAGLKEVPAIIRDFSDSEIMEISLIENIQREDLNPLELAEAYKKLMDELQLTQDEVAQKVGKSRSAVANILRLLNLDKRVRDYIADGILTEGHARAIAAIPNHEFQYEMAKRVIDEDLNVRQTEKLIKNTALSKLKEKVKKKKGKDPYLEDIQERLTNHFGTKVVINHGRKKGKIEIEYYSRDDLQRILDIINML